MSSCQKSHLECIGPKISDFFNDLLVTFIKKFCFHNLMLLGIGSQNLLQMMHLPLKANEMHHKSKANENTLKFEAFILKAIVCIFSFFTNVN